MPFDSANYSRVGGFEPGERISVTTRDGAVLDGWVEMQTYAEWWLCVLRRADAKPVAAEYHISELTRLGGVDAEWQPGKRKRS